MAITNGYCTGDELATHMSNTRSGFSAAGDVETAIEACARDIDAWCGRRFYKDNTATARIFYPASGHYLPIDDAWLVSALTIDGVAADPADYDEVPLNGVRDGIEGWPVLALRVPDDGTSPTTFLRKCVVTAKWGWAAVPTPVKSANLLMAAELVKTGDIPMIDEFQNGAPEMRTVYRQLRVYRDGLRAVPVGVSLRDLNLNDVCAEIAGRVATANPEIDARDYPAPQSGAFPVFYLEVPALTYRTTSRKSDFELRGVILVGQGPDADSVRALRSYLEPSALLADIEGDDRTLGGLVDHIAVTGSSEMSLEEYMTVGAWGASLTIQIMGKTT